MAAIIKSGAVVQAAVTVTVTVTARVAQGKDSMERDMPWATPLGVAVCLDHHEGDGIMVLTLTRRMTF